MLSLEVTAGPGTGRTVELDGEIVIGREDATLVIDDPEMSRRHARVAPVEGGVVVEDLGSTNGTFVNGERVSGQVTLNASGTIHLGTTDLEVKIPVAELTRVRDVADFNPDVTRARPIADPSATVQRPIADPDVTAQRPIAGPPEPAAEPPPPAAPAESTAPAPAQSAGPPVVLLAIGAVAAVVIVVVLVLVVL